MQVASGVPAQQPGPSIRPPSLDSAASATPATPEPAAPSTEAAGQQGAASCPGSSTATSAAMIQLSSSGSSPASRLQLACASAQQPALLETPAAAPAGSQQQPRGYTSARAGSSAAGDSVHLAEPLGCAAVGQPSLRSGAATSLGSHTSLSSAAPPSPSPISSVCAISSKGESGAAAAAAAADACSSAPPAQSPLGAQLGSAGSSRVPAAAGQAPAAMGKPGSEGLVLGLGSAADGQHMAASTPGRGRGTSHAIDQGREPPEAPGHRRLPGNRDGSGTCMPGGSQPSSSACDGA